MIGFDIGGGVGREEREGRERRRETKEGGERVTLARWDHRHFSARLGLLSTARCTDTICSRARDRCCGDYSRARRRSQGIHA